MIKSIFCYAFKVPQVLQGSSRGRIVLSPNPLWRQSIFNNTCICKNHIYRGELTDLCLSQTVIFHYFPHNYCQSEYRKWISLSLRIYRRATTLLKNTWNWSFTTVGVVGNSFVPIPLSPVWLRIKTNHSVLFTCICLFSALCL